MRVSGVLEFGFAVGILGVDLRPWGVVDDDVMNGTIKSSSSPLGLYTPIDVQNNAICGSMVLRVRPPGIYLVRGFQKQSLQEFALLGKSQ